MTQVPQGSVVAVMAEGKDHALAVGITSLSTDEMSVKFKKLHFYLASCLLSAYHSEVVVGIDFTILWLVSRALLPYCQSYTVLLLVPVK